MSKHRRRWASARRRWSGPCSTREARMMRRAVGEHRCQDWGAADLMRQVRADMAADLGARLRDPRRLIIVTGV